MPRRVTTAARIRSECFASPLRRLARLVNSLYDEALRPVGLTIGQLNLLVAIADLGDGATATRLARGLAIEKSTLSRDLARLEASGLVRRRDDGRSKRLELSADGAKKIEAALPLWECAQARAEASLPSLAALRAMLRADEAARTASD